MSTVIKVEHLSKKFIIGHREKEKYTALRDVMARKAKKIISFPFTLGRTSSGYVTEEFWALKDINFEIAEGDRVGIIGRNGAGKSTLLKVLSRITEPTEGRISIKGRVASLLEVGTGFHPELTGRENIFLNGAILGMSRSEIRGKFDEIVAFAEVERFLDTPVKRYSSGMYVRLAFAVAAHLEPEILIVDEVLAVGDAQFQKKCLGKMEDVSKNQGRTVLFVSHQMGTIAQLCEKAILLQRGKVLSNGPTPDVIQYYLNRNSDNNSQTNKYEFAATEEKVLPIYFSEIFTTDIKGKEAQEFGFDEIICVYSKICIMKKTPNLKIGITLQSIHGYYISTSIFELSEAEKIQDNYIMLKAVFPPNVIAPNSYYFRLAAFTDNEVFDVQENVCNIKVVDTGSVLSKYEGVNYGSVILNTSWSIL